MTHTLSWGPYFFQTVTVLLMRLHFMPCLVAIPFFPLVFFWRLLWHCIFWFFFLQDRNTSARYISGIRKLAWHWAWRAWRSAWWAWLYPTAQDFERGERGCEWDRSGIWAWSWTNCSGLSVVSAGVSTWAKGVCMTTSITLYTGVMCWSTIHHWTMIATRLL